MRLRELDCRGPAGPATIAAALSAGTPVVLRGLGAVPDWPPAAWGASPAAVLDAAGPDAAATTVVSCMATDALDAQTGVATFAGAAGERTEVSRTLACALVGGGGGGGGDGGTPAAAVYLAQAPVSGLPPGLAAPLPPALASAGATLSGPPTLWVAPPARGGGAPGGCLTSVHHDDGPAVLVVTAGAKAVRTVAPGAAAVGAGVAARPPWGEAPNHAEPGADLGVRPPPRPGLPVRAEGVGEAVLGPGDGLLIPPGAWHQVGTSPGSVALSFPLAERGGGERADAVALRTAARGVAAAAAEAALASIPAAWVAAGGGGGGEGEGDSRKRPAPGADDPALAADDAARLLRSPLVGGRRGAEASEADPLGLASPVARALGALPDAAAVRGAILSAARACPAALSARLGAPGAGPPVPPLPPAAAALVARALDDAAPAFLARLASALGGPARAGAAMRGLLAGREAFDAGVGRPAVLSVLGLL